MRKFFSKFFIGFSSGIVGFKLIIKNTSLLRTSIMPFIISICLVIAGLVFGYKILVSLLSLFVPNFLISFFSSLIPQGFFYNLIGSVIGIVGYLVFVIFWIFLMFLLINIICIPFHSLLAEKTLINLQAFKQKPFSLINWSKTWVKMFLISIARTIIILIIGVVTFLMSFIFPGFSIFTGFVGLLILTSDCLDYSLELLEFGLIERFTIFKKYFAELFGFCCFFAILPGLNLLLMPVAVVGASWLIVKLNIENKAKNG